MTYHDRLIATRDDIHEKLRLLSDLDNPTPREALRNLQEIGTLVLLPCPDDPDPGKAPEFPIPWDADFIIDGHMLVINGNAGASGFGCAVVTIPYEKGLLKKLGLYLQFDLGEKEYFETSKVLLEVVDLEISVTE